MDVIQHGPAPADWPVSHGPGWLGSNQAVANRVTETDVKIGQCSITLDLLKNCTHIVRLPYNGKHLLLSVEGAISLFGVSGKVSIYMDYFKGSWASSRLYKIYKWLPAIDYVPSEMRKNTSQGVSYKCLTSVEKRTVEWVAEYSLGDQKVYHFVPFTERYTFSEDSPWSKKIKVRQYINSSKKELFKRSIIHYIAPYIKLIEATHGKYTKYNPLVVFYKTMIVFAEWSKKYALATTIIKIVNIAAVAILLAAAIAIPIVFSRLDFAAFSFLLKRYPSICELSNLLVVTIVLIVYWIQIGLFLVSGYLLAKYSLTDHE